MKRKWSLIILSVWILCTLCACKEPEPIYDNELSELPVVSAKWIQPKWEIPCDIWEHDVEKDAVRPTYNEIRDAGAISVLRYNEGRYYSVSRISDGSYLFVLYQRIPSDTKPEEVADLLVLEDGFRVKKLLPRSAERFIKICFTPKDSVPLWDPNGYYIEGEDEPTPISYHRFSDRSTMIFFCDVNEKDEWVVTFAGTMPDSTNSVLTYLLDADLELVS